MLSATRPAAIALFLTVLSACGSAAPATLPPAAAPTSTVAPPSATAPPPPTPTLIPTHTPAPVLPSWPVLRRGDWDEAIVFALQRLLRESGQSLIIDGKFGRQTEGAVRGFQTSHGLSPSGVMTSQTWDALVYNVRLSEGSSGEAVRGVEFLLQRKFGYDLEVDNDFGPDTTQVLMEFESTVPNMIVDGIVDPITWQALIALPTP